MATDGQLCVRNAERTQKIAELNDTFRKTGQGGTFLLTRGVVNLPGMNFLALIKALAAFDRFDDGNNPYGERDFGDVDFGGTYLLWKIEYYDLEMEHASPDPTDPAVTKRVMTVMLPEEY